MHELDHNLSQLRTFPFKNKIKIKTYFTDYTYLNCTLIT